MIDERTITNWFTYHPPVGDQSVVYETIRAHAREFAHILNNLVPDGPDKTVAMRKLRECVFIANAAVACAPGEVMQMVPPPIPPVAPTRRADAPAQTSAWPTPADTGGQGPVPKSGPPSVPNAVSSTATGRSMDDLVADYMARR
jgi:hypothetical protein